MSHRRHRDSGESSATAVARRVSWWLVAAVALTANRAAAQPTPADWLGGDGNWTTAALWSTNPNYPNNGTPPGTTYAASIAAPGTYTVTLNSAVTVSSLTLNGAGATLDLSGGGLTVVDSATLTAGVLRLDSGTINGGTFGGTGGVIRFDSSPNNILNGVTIANPGILDLSPAGSRVQLRGGTALGPGAVAVGTSAFVHLNQVTTASGASFVLGNNAFLTAEGGGAATLGATTLDVVTVTVNPGAFQAANIRTNLLGAAAGTVLVNRGTIRFDPAATNATLNITPFGGGAFRNEGVVAVGGSNTVNLTGPFQNAGTLAISGGTLNLAGDFTTANLGALNRTGGVVNVTGNLDNTGATLALTDAGPVSTGSFTLASGGTITGGTVTTVGSARLLADSSPSNALVGVSLPAGALDLSPAGSRVQLRGGTALGPGVVSVGPNSLVHLNQASTASGASFLLGNNAFLTAEGGTMSTLGAAADVVTVTVNPGAFQAAGIRTNFLGAATGTVLVNRGTIRFDPAAVNAALNISPSGGGTFRNEGVLAVNGTNTVNLSGPFQNAGTFAVSGGTLNLAGNFTTAGLGSLNRSGGVVNVTGNLDNTGATLALTDAGPASTGSLTLANGGTITGGTIMAAGSARLLADASPSNALVGVGLATGMLDLTPTGSRVQLRGGTTVGAGAVPVGENSILHLNQVTTASGTSFILGKNASLTAEGGTTSTLGAATPDVVTVTVNPGAGQQAAVRTNFLGLAAGTLLVNQGTVRFDPASTNATLNINTSNGGGSFQNAGVLSAGVAGSRIAVTSLSFTNAGTLTASGGGTVVVGIATDFTNFGGGILASGTYVALNGSAIDFDGRAVTTLAANTTVTLSGPGSVFAAVDGLTANNGTFNVVAGRTFTVAGGTLTNAGTLTVGQTAGDGSTLTGNVVVSGGGLLRGTGTVAGGMTVNGGTLAPGVGPGLLTVTGAVTLAGGATFAAELNGATAGPGYDQLRLAGGGSIDLGGATLATTLAYAPTDADGFTIVSGGPVSGTFAGLPNGAAVSLGTFGGVAYSRVIVYGPTSVVLIPVPEPAHVLLACAAAAAAAGRWRRKA